MLFSIALVVGPATPIDQVVRVKMHKMSKMPKPKIFHNSGPTNIWWQFIKFN